jgi:Flp pilus assembly protein TadD
VALRPDDAAGWQNLGVALFLREQTADAIDACRKAIAAGGDLAAVTHNLAIGLSAAGRHDDALTEIARIPAPGESLQLLRNRIRLARLKTRVKAMLRGLWPLS